MTESEQAQAIAEIKAVRNGGEYPRTYYREAIDKALEIVDSQAQKIADLNRVGSNTLLALIEAQEKIAEQAKEIERLTKERDDARKLAEDSRDDEYDNDMDLSVAENRAARREYAKNHPLPWEKP